MKTTLETVAEDWAELLNDMVITETGKTLSWDGRQVIAKHLMRAIADIPDGDDLVVAAWATRLKERAA